MNPGIWGWDLGNLQWRKVLIDASGHLQVDVITAGGTASHCYGWDGAAWQTLLVEDDTDFNLRVKLYDGADGIDSQAGGAALTTERGLVTASVIYGTVAPNNSVPVYAATTGADARGRLDVALNTASLLHGFNGTTWDRLRVESNVAFNLRVKLYDGANAIDTATGTPDLTTERGLITKSLVMGKIAAANLRPCQAISAGQDSLTNAKITLIITSLLYGYDGSNWDRLRSYGTGILKVGRAEVGLSTSNFAVDTTVKATPGDVYWITIVNNDPANASYVTIKDGGSGGAVKWSGGTPGVRWKALHAVFDPPIECATDIYVDLTGDAGGSLPTTTVGYL